MAWFQADGGSRARLRTTVHHDLGVTVTKNLNPLERLVRLYGQMAILGGLTALLALGGFFVSGISGALCAAGLAIGLSTLCVGVWARRRGQKMLASTKSGNLGSP